MANSPDVDPVPDHVTAVLEQVAVLRLAQMAKELKHPLTASVSLLKDGAVVGTGATLIAGTRGGPAQHGELRLVFQEVSEPDTRQFHLDAVFPSDERAPTFSGFSVTGQVVSRNGSITTRAGSWAIHRDHRDDVSPS
jgi:hypothetical protein